MRFKGLLSSESLRIRQLSLAANVDENEDLPRGNMVSPGGLFNVQ